MSQYNFCSHFNTLILRTAYKWICTDLLFMIWKCQRGQNNNQPEIVKLFLWIINTGFLPFTLKYMACFSEIIFFLWVFALLDITLFIGFWTYILADCFQYDTLILVCGNYPFKQILMNWKVLMISSWFILNSN